MPRNNADFQNQVLYHGSSSAIPVGGLVEPRDGVAHATPYLSTAEAFAYGLFGGGNGTVHIVEPIEGDDSLFVPKKKPREIRSTKGFRVVGHVNGKK